MVAPGTLSELLKCQYELKRPSWGNYTASGNCFGYGYDLSSWANCGAGFISYRGHGDGNAWYSQ